MRVPSSAGPSVARRHRVTIVLSHPVQYYSPWFRQLAVQPDLETKVLYLEPRDPAGDREFGGRADWDRDVLAGYPWTVVPNWAPVRDVSRFGGLINPGLRRHLRRPACDAIVLFGYASVSAWLTLVLARQRRIPVLLRGDSHDLGREPSALSLARARIALRLCAAFLSPGSAHRAFLLRRGAPADRIFACPHAVDAAWFDPDRAGVREAADRIRRDVGAGISAPVVLFAGKWIEKKQPVALAEAFRAVAPPDARLLFVGAGAGAEALHALAAVDGRIRVIGFVNQSALPEHYLAADVFALPSRGAHETWGLAVNEAMRMGVPCLVSRVVGCQPDLVVPGRTGWVCEPDDAESLRRTLATALNEIRPDRTGWARRVRDQIAGFSYEAATTGLRAALKCVAAP